MRTRLTAGPFGASPPASPVVEGSDKPVEAGGDAGRRDRDHHRGSGPKDHDVRQVRPDVPDGADDALLLASALARQALRHEPDGRHDRPST